jgi:hypothetical protein
VDRGGARRRHQRLELAPRGVYGEVLAHGAGEQEGVLQHDADLRAQRAQVEAREIFAVEGDAAAPGQIEAEEQLAQRALARAARAHQRHLAAGLDLEAHALHDVRPIWVIRERDVLELDAAAQAPGWRGCGSGGAFAGSPCAAAPRACSGKRAKTWRSCVRRMPARANASSLPTPPERTVASAAAALATAINPPRPSSPPRTRLAPTKR